LHHPPGVDFADALRAERLESLDLGLDVVGLDVEMDPARGRNCLNFDLELPARINELDVLPFLAGEGANFQPERSAPELGRSGEIVCPAIDDEARASALVHRSEEHTS